MKVLLLLLLLIMMLSVLLVHTHPPHKRSSGFERLRDRIHRKRHRHHHIKTETLVINEPDEVFEMSMTSPDEMTSSSSDSSFSSKVRSEKSIVSSTTTTPSEGGVGDVVKNPHHHHHQKTSGGGRREKNEALCQSRRTTVELNNPSHEFEPPFFVEVRCLNTPPSSSSSSSSAVFGSVLEEQTCFKGMLRCVQQYQDVHVSRRSAGSVHWHPYTLNDVAVACECMWPVDKYGHQEF